MIKDLDFNEVAMVHRDGKYGGISFIFILPLVLYGIDDVIFIYSMLLRKQSATQIHNFLCNHGSKRNRRVKKDENLSLSMTGRTM